MKHLKMKLLATVLAIPLAMPAFAANVITVGDIEGGDSDCKYKYQELQSAIDEAISMGAGEEVTIRLAVPGGFETSGTAVENPPRDIRIHGGFQACADDEPDPTKPTPVRLQDSNGQRLFTLSADTGNTERTITLERLILDGQENDNNVSDGGLVSTTKCNG